MTSPSARSAGPPAELSERFARFHGVRPAVFRAPGRVNLIGEHTDYNDGFVMPAAIGFYSWVAVAPRSDRLLHVVSDQFSETAELNIDELEGPPRKHWSDYIRGIAAMLRGAGVPLSGANLMIHGEVPLGAGLSSSAAIEVSTALALLHVSAAHLGAMELVKLCQRAEHEYAGTRCGIMDQFISMFGKADHALMLDCRSLQYSLLPLPADVRLVICNSMVKHELTGGEYNRRRADCEAGVAALKNTFPKISALRDVTVEQLQQAGGSLPEVVLRRCRHVISENRRVQDAAAALNAGNMATFGALMEASHASLRDDYEVSCEELNLLVDIALPIEGVYGARMTGGGFGGCTVNLVHASAVSCFHAQVAEAYRKRTGKTPSIYTCSPAQGAGPVF
jgi:galactokinase